MPGDHLFATPDGGSIDDFLRVELSAAVAGAIQGARRGVGKHLADLAAVLRARNSASQRRQLHREIGAAAQQSVLRSYDQTVTARKKVASYREGDRYSGGALRKALGDPSFFTADARGIDFINRDMLDERAAHWARLNAGAAPAGKGSQRRFPLRFGEVVVLSLGVDMVPSEPFKIPPGYWWDPTSGQPVAPGGAPAQFFLRGTGPRSGASSHLMAADDEGTRRRVNFQTPKMTAGIQARNFLDAGVRTIANRLGPGYDELYRRMFDRGVAQVRPQRIKAHVSQQKIQTSL